MATRNLIRISLRFLNIRKQSDRLFGGGIEVYPAFFSTNNKKAESAVRPVFMEDMKDGRTEFTGAGRRVIDLEIENGTCATFDIFMMEADGSSDNIRNVLKQLETEARPVNFNGAFDDFGRTGPMVAGIFSVAAGVGIAVTGVPIVFAGLSVAGAAAVLVPGGLIIAGIFLFAMNAPGTPDDCLGVWRGLAAVNEDGTAVKVGITSACQGERGRERGREKNPDSVRLHQDVWSANRRANRDDQRRG